MLAINIATFGASGEATALAKEAEVGTDIISQMKSKFDDIKKLYDKHEDFFNFIQNAAKVGSGILTAKDVINFFQMTNPQPADLIRVAA